MCFRQFSGIGARHGLELAVFERVRALLEADEEWHIRTVRHALEDADRPALDLAVAAKINGFERPDLLADFHPARFAWRRDESSKGAAAGRPNGGI